MKPMRILLVFIALIAGGLAAFIATRENNQPDVVAANEVVRVVEEPKARILIASRALGLGQKLSSDDISWQEWPESAMREEFLVQNEEEDLLEELLGTPVRYEFFQGEPIRMSKLAPSKSGFLSAVLAEGMRAVSLSVTPESASGGFIVPNDRVDVVLSRSGSNFSETLLSNIRILAIGPQLGEIGTTSGDDNSQEPQAKVFETTQVATMELTPSQAEVLLNAGSAGRIALVLRSVNDFNKTTTEQAQNRSSAIQVVRYGNSSSVVSGTGAEDSVQALDDPTFVGTSVPSYDPNFATPEPTELLR